MDSGKWLDELRSGFGENLRSGLGPVSQSGSSDPSQEPPELSSSAGSGSAPGASSGGSEVAGWSAEFSEDGHDIESATWLDTLKVCIVVPPPPSQDLSGNT